MKLKEILKYIREVIWDNVKDLSHDFRRISLIDISNKEYEAYLYLVIINSGKKRNKYLGYRLASNFIESYTGTLVKNIEEYSDDLFNYEWRIICLAIGTEREMRTKEGNLLKIVKEENWDEYYNESTQTFLKGYTSNEAVKRVMAGLESIPETTLPKEEWHDMERFQTREVPEVPGLVRIISDYIEDSKGKWIVINHKGVLVLKDYFGKGKHLRLGSYHTIEASMPSKYVKTLKGKLVPKELWKGIDLLGLEFLADVDNKREGEDGRVTVSPTKALDWCRRAIEQYDIKHNDDMIKEYLMECGFNSPTMNRDFWPHLREDAKAKKVKGDIPQGHQLIDYHNTASGKQSVQDIKDTWESDDCHCLVLGTSYFHSHWEGLPAVIIDLADENLLKKKFWKIFIFHKNPDAKKNWPERQIIIEKILNNLIAKFEKEYKIEIDIESLPYSTPKEKLLANDKKAA